MKRLPLRTDPVRRSRTGGGGQLYAKKNVRRKEQEQQEEEEAGWVRCLMHEVCVRGRRHEAKSCTYIYARLPGTAIQNIQLQQCCSAAVQKHCESANGMRPVKCLEDRQAEKGQTRPSSTSREGRPLPSTSTSYDSGIDRPISRCSYFII